MMRVSHDYHRGGVLACLAAYDVHRAKIYGRFDATTDIEPFTRTGPPKVKTQEPYTSADPHVLGRRHRHVPPRTEGHRPARRTVPQPGHGAHPGPPFLAQPGGEGLSGRRWLSAVAWTGLMGLWISRLRL
jgi:hypothetical protein